MKMNVTNDEQAKLWNGAAGRTWVDAQQTLDQMFQGIEALLVDAAMASRPASVLDVGCGTGSTTLAMARRLGGQGSCVGIDISDPMIAHARRRAAEKAGAAAFVCGDAQIYPFEAASFDLFISRFGVMFFEDPVSAFRNLRRAATDAAQLKLVVWRSAEENGFMTTAERAAAEFLPQLPPRQQDLPGQFAFWNPERVRHILEAGGWGDVDLRPIDVPCSFPESELVGYLSRLGPVGRILQEADEHMRANVIRKIRGAFDPYVHGDQVTYIASCWLISATAG
jgi:SAM-dependent methyltransferase